MATAYVKLAHVETATDGYAALVAADGASNHWRLGESSGTTAADAIGSDDGTIDSGVTLAQESIISGDTAMQFDATVDGRITVPHAAFMEVGTASFSVECWVKTVAHPIVDGIILDTTPVNGSLRPGVLIFQETFGSLTNFYVAVGDTVNVLSIASHPALSVIGQWHHLVAVLDRENSELRLYQDGSSGPATAIAPGRNFSASSITDMQIGRGSFFYVTDFRGFNGLIDEVAWYPLALTASQVANHYAVGLTLDHLAGIDTGDTIVVNLKGLMLTPAEVASHLAGSIDGEALPARP